MRPWEGSTTLKVYELIKEKKRVSIREVREAIPANYNTIRSGLIRLTNEGLIERVGRGVYEYRSEYRSE